MATKSNKSVKKKVTMTKAMVEKSLNSAMAEVDALSLNLAQAREAKDMLAGQMETAVESHMNEISALQEKIMLLQFDIERKDGLLEFIKDKISNFQSDWKDLRGKPWKRFWRAVGLLGDIMDIMVEIMNKIDEEHNWGGSSVEDVA